MKNISIYIFDKVTTCWQLICQAETGCQLCNMKQRNLFTVNTVYIYESLWSGRSQVSRAGSLYSNSMLTKQLILKFKLGCKKCLVIKRTNIFNKLNTSFENTSYFNNMIKIYLLNFKLYFIVFFLLICCCVTVWRWETILSLLVWLKIF